jgi:hypothetical protein
LPADESVDGGADLDRWDMSQYASHFNRRFILPTQTRGGVWRMFDNGEPDYQALHTVGLYTEDGGQNVENARREAVYYPRRVGWKIHFLRDGNWVCLSRKFPQAAILKTTDGGHSW